MLSGAFNRIKALPLPFLGNVDSEADVATLYDSSYLPKKKPVYRIVEGTLYDPVSGMYIPLEDLIYSRVDPTDKRFTLSAIDIAFLKKDFDAVIGMANNLLAANPDNVNAMSSKANALAKKGDIAGSLALNNKALEIDSNCPVLLFNRALDLLILERPEEALSDIKKSIEFDTDAYIPAYGVLAGTLFQLGREEEALDALEKGLGIKKSGILPPLQLKRLAGLVGCESVEEALEEIRKRRKADRGEDISLGATAGLHIN